jgi:6-bladed beta-propeller
MREATHRSRWLWVWLVSVAGAIGCGTPADVPAGYAIRDSAGIRITDVTMSMADLPEWTLADPADLVLDGSGAGGGPFFETVSSAMWTHEGGIIVLDRGADQLHLFDGQGRFVRSFGRSGKGPGEFGNIANVTVTADDSIFVFDRVSDRISVFHPDAGFVRDLNLRPDSIGKLPLDVWEIAPDRFLLYVLSFPTDWIETWDGKPFVLQYEGRLTTHDNTGGLIAGPLTFPGSQSIQHQLGDLGPPLAPRAYIDALPGRIVYGTGIDYDIRLLDVNLRPVAIMRWPGSRERIVDGDLEEIRAANRRTFAVRPELGQQITDAVLADEVVPEWRPAHGELVLGADSSVWVSRFEPTTWGKRWHIYDADGRPAARIELPPGARLLGADAGRVLLVRPDSLDIPSVYVHRLLTS